jgi:hypothetical protein
MSVSAAEWEKLLSDKNEFLRTVVQGMVGWLDSYAARRTVDLLEFQERIAVSGSLYEVGVYHGKYFSLLVRSAALTGEKALGIDLFEYLTPEKFQAYFDEKFSPSTLAEIRDFRWSVLARSSADLTASQVLAELGNEARFVSVDGSHEYDDVLWDLRVAEQVLAAGGIIVADDFINPICLGVTAAIYHFLEGVSALVPFAHVSNKLFLCRPGWADRYRSALELAVLADAEEPRTQAYRKHYDAGALSRRNIEAVFRGYRILTIQ